MKFNLFIFKYQYDRALANREEGVYTFKMNGTITHLTKSLIPTDGTPHAFGQIYFLGPDQQTDRRKTIMSDLSQNLIREILTMLTDCNPFVNRYHHAAHFARNHPDEEFQLVIYLEKNVDRRRYNKPTAQEVAAVIIGADRDILNTNREIRIYSKDPVNNDNFHTIRDDHSAYDPLHYVLMHPFGEHGWAYKLYPKINARQINPPENPIEIEHIQADAVNNVHEINAEEEINNSENESINRSFATTISSVQNQSFHSDFVNNEIDADNDFYLGDVSVSSQKYVTCADFYSSRLMRFEDSTHQFFSNLLQQYIVDQYIKIEGNKLKFIRHNQAKLRVELYKGLVDAYNKRDTSLGDTCRLVILPSSFSGGPRYMLNLFQDSMAIVKDFGRPDLFCTFTCNPYWIEILRELTAGQTAVDAPDLVARVFKLKLRALMDFILKNTFSEK